MSGNPAAASFLLTCLRVLRQMGEVFGSRWATLLAAGLLIFVPLGLIETIDASFQESLEEADELGAGDVLELLAIGTLHAGGAVLGEVLFAGVVTASVIVVHVERRTTVRELVRRLALRRLILGDIAYA